MTKLSAPTFVSNSGVLYGNVAEILPGQLFFASFSSPPTSDATTRYVSIDDKVHYDPFYKDFGPLNLSVLYRFTQHLHTIVEARTKRRIVAYTDATETNRVNGAYLMASYLVIYHGVKADIAYLRVEPSQPPEFLPFRDAAMGASTWDLHLHDVLRGLEKGLQHKWFDTNDFEADEYEFYERVENGDFNWIIPSKILSFCGPHENSVIENGYPYHAPEVYFDYFHSHGISTIVRLNMPMYDAKRFTDAGFEHVDLFFVDGSTPSDEIVRKFIRVVDRAGGGVAIHCKAGLGRTGTLIACWMMKEFGMTAPECISWLRICRPGSVIGPQQEFLLEKQQLCWEIGGRVPVVAPSGALEKKLLKMSRLVHKVDDISLRGNESGGAGPEKIRPGTLPLSRKESDNLEEQTDSAGRSQGDRLQLQKLRRQICQVTRAHFTSPTTPVKPVYVPPSTSVSSSSRSRLAARNILHSSPKRLTSAGSSASASSSSSSNSAALPISRVTVTTAKPGSISKSSSALRKIIGQRCLPYPSSARHEMPASSYQLRPRRSFSPKAYEVARFLPPNAAALGAVSLPSSSSTRTRLAKKKLT